jgi:hypothetical protein
VRNQRTGRLTQRTLPNHTTHTRLGWPDLLEHPFVRETEGERLVRERALADAVELADSSRAWKGEGGAVAGAVLAAAHRSDTPNRGGRPQQGSGSGQPGTPPPQAAQTPSATRQQPAAANRRVGPAGVPPG